MILGLIGLVVTSFVLRFVMFGNWDEWIKKQSGDGVD